MKQKPRGDLPDKNYKRQLYELQVQLVKFQRSLIEGGKRVLVIVEGRDGAGKDGAIKRLTEHLSPRDTRIFAPGKPSSREESEWYFQRFIPELPAAGEFVIFNRSWYNRAGVERVMGFCTPIQLKEFFSSAVELETMLVRSGIVLFKYYLDIDKDEQKKRLAARRRDPLKQWKISPIDAKAIEKWDDYSRARDEMFARTSHKSGPWRIIRADEKKPARLNLIRDLLSSLNYKGKDKKLVKPDRKTVFDYYDGVKAGGLLAP